MMKRIMIMIIILIIILMINNQMIIMIIIVIITRVIIIQLAHQVIIIILIQPKIHQISKIKKKLKSLCVILVKEKISVHYVGKKSVQELVLEIYMPIQTVIMKELVVYAIKKVLEIKFNLFVQIVEKVQIQKVLLVVLDALYAEN